MDCLLNENQYSLVFLCFCDKNPFLLDCLDYVDIETNEKHTRFLHALNFFSKNNFFITTLSIQTSVKTVKIILIDLRGWVICSEKQSFAFSKNYFNRQYLYAIWNAIYQYATSFLISILPKRRREAIYKKARCCKRLIQFCFSQNQYINMV